MPKRILIFSITYLPFVGGAEVAVKEITDRLDPTEFQFDMITLRFDRKLPAVEKIGNVTVHRIGFATDIASIAETFSFPLAANKYLFPFLALKKANQLHAQKPYDAIWSIMANYAGFGAVLFKMAHVDVPMILTLQEGDPIEHIKHRVRYVYPLFKKIFTRANRIQTISKFLATFAADMGARAPVVVIPNGVDTKAFSKDVSVVVSDALRKKLGLEAGDALVITASRLVAKNAVDDIIRALHLLPHHVKLVIAGQGPDEAKLRGLARERGVADRVAFIGQLTHAELAAYFHAADIFVRPSVSEGMGNAFIEAMATGLPVIATPVGGIVDFLFDPETNPGTPATGLFCEVRNAGSIAKQIMRLLHDEDLGKRLAANARTMVAASYEWEGITKRMRTEVFDPVVTAPRT